MSLIKEIVLYQIRQGAVDVPQKLYKFRRNLSRKSTGLRSILSTLRIPEPHPPKEDVYFKKK